MGEGTVREAGYYLKKWGVRPSWEGWDAWAGVADMPGPEAARYFVMGSMVGWGTIGLPAPPEDVPLFELGPRGPYGALVDFIDTVFAGSFVWKANLKGSSVPVYNHFAMRVFYDLTHRNSYADDERFRALYNLVAGPTSGGKTGPLAVYALAVFFAFRKVATVKVCSKSKSGAQNRIWGDIMSWYRNSWYAKNEIEDGEIRAQNTTSELRLLYIKKGEDLQKGRKGEIKDIRNGIECLAIPRGADGMGASQNLIGIKNGIKLLIVDEAQHLDESIFSDDVNANWAKAGHTESKVAFSQTVYLTNPIWQARKLVQCYRPEGGWTDPDFVDTETPGWRTLLGGWVTNLNGLDTPNRNFRYARDPERRTGEQHAPFPFLISRTDIERETRRCGGAETAAFASKVMGRLVEDARSDTVLTPRMVELAGAMDAEPEWVDDKRVSLLAADPAFGGDLFQLTGGVLGMAFHPDHREPVAMLKIGSSWTVPYAPGANATAEQQQVEFVLGVCKQLDIEPERFASDATGTSLGFVTAFEAEVDAPIHRVVFSAAATQRLAAPGDTRVGKDAYRDMRSEVALAVRHHISYIRNLSCQETIDEFCTRTFTLVAGNKILLGNKLEFRKDYGKSPDRSDCVSILVDVARDFGLGTGSIRGSVEGGAFRGSAVVTRDQLYADTGVREGLYQAV